MYFSSPHSSHRAVICIALLASFASEASAVPPGLVDEPVITGFTEPVGLTFSPDGRMFVWEKAGKVWIVEDGVKTLLLDISDEVLNWWDHGLLGFALDPDFNDNGYIYLLYPVDFAYLLANGDPQGTNPFSPVDAMHDTIGRLVRYTCTNPATSPEVDPGSWKILIGHWETNPSPPHTTDGIPMTSSSHGPDTLLFGTDGTLLVSIGDGADFATTDIGGARNTTYSTNTAEADGILTLAERVGSFRSQLVNSYCGKILRLDVSDIDPVLGCPGLSSNPWYDSEDPFAPRSKVWAMGLRNPYRFCIRPGTGSTDPAEGDPGTLYVGDVGRSTWEELDIVPSDLARQGKANFGWPRFEGLSSAPGHSTSTRENRDAPNPLYDDENCTQQFFRFNQLIVEAVDTGVLSPSWPNPCDAGVQIPAEFTHMHARPLFDWRHGTAQTRIPIFNANGTAATVNIDAPNSPVEGQNFSGQCALGGVFYSGDKFPEVYHDTYFFGDCRTLWIRNLAVDADDAAIEVRDFVPVAVGLPVSLEVDLEGYGLYYVSLTIGQVRRIAADCNENGVGDDIDIAQAVVTDCDANGRPDPCDPPWTDIDLFVDQILSEAPAPSFVCLYDANGDASLDGLDILPFIDRIVGP